MTVTQHSSKNIRIHYWDEDKFSTGEEVQGHHSPYSILHTSRDTGTCRVGY